MKTIQQFHVGIKAFLMQESRLLLLREAATGLWEIPGGRIDVGEELIPQREVLARELGEELGPGVQVEVGPIALTWVRPRLPGFTFLVGLLCRLAGGEIVLSAEHDRLAWVDAESWRDFELAHGYDSALAEFWRVLPGLPAPRR